MDNVDAFLYIFSLFGIIEKGEKKSRFNCKTIEATEKLSQENFQSGKIAQWLRACTTLPEDQGSVPCTHIWRLTTASNS